MTAFSGIGKFLLLAGVFLALFGLLLVFWDRIPLLGKLPGDLIITKGNFRVAIPIMTCLIISVLLTILANVVLRLMR